MLTKNSKLGFLVLLLSFLSACANTPFYHQNFMRGQVVSVNNSKAVVCIGSHKNSLVDKSLSVYKIEYEVGTEEGDDGFRRVYVGSLKIDSIINEHFARATIISGEVTQNNIVEISR